MKSKAIIFEIVYLAIAITTFQHTAWAASTVFEGTNTATTKFSIDAWWITGILMAIAIDIGMFVVAWFLTGTKSRREAAILTVAFLLLAGSSFYMQILYAVAHSDPYTVGAGVTEAWAHRLQPLLDARIVVIPMMLPLFAIAYTLAAIEQKTNERHEAELTARPRPEYIDGDWILNGKPLAALAEEQHRLALPAQVEGVIELTGDGIQEQLGYTCHECGIHREGYKTASTRRSAIKTHITQKHPQLAVWRQEGNE